MSNQGPFSYRIDKLKIEIIPEWRSPDMAVVDITVRGSVKSFSEDPRFSQSYPAEDFHVRIPMGRNDMVAPFEHYMAMAVQEFKRFIKENEPKPLFRGGGPQ